MRLSHSVRHRNRNPHIIDIEEFYDEEHTEVELEERALKQASFDRSTADSVLEDFDLPHEEVRMNPLDRYFSSWL